MLYFVGAVLSILLVEFLLLLIFGGPSAARRPSHGGDFRNEYLSASLSLIIIAPIAAWIGGFILASVYNFAVKFIGGIKVTFRDAG